MEAQTTETGITPRSPQAITQADRLPADRHPLLVYTAALASDHSRRGATGAARRALAIILDVDRDTITPDRLRAFPWHELRYQHVQAVKARLLSSGAGPATINVTLAHLRGISREAWRLGLMGADEHARIQDVSIVKGETLPAGRALTAGEIRALFEVCGSDPSPIGSRDAALLAVLYGTGLRRAEAAALTLSDFNPDTGELKVRRGKGRKDRITYATNGTADALKAWIEIRGPHTGALFHPVTKGGQIEHRPMTTQAIFNTCIGRAADAGLESFTPHDLRRTFVSDLLDAGADVGSVQRLAGHANVNTTLRYDRRPEGAKRKAADMLRVPFVRGVRQSTPRPTAKRKRGR